MTTPRISLALRRALRPLRRHVHVAWIHGSVARNEDTPSSDIDLVVVGDVRMEVLVVPLQRAGARLGRDIHPMLYGEAELRRRPEAGNHFVRSITAADAIFVVGGRDDLKELVVAWCAERG
jgi:predicted nucleotidyltransferase